MKVEIGLSLRSGIIHNSFIIIKRHNSNRIVVYVDRKQMLTNTGGRNESICYGCQRTVGLRCGQ